MAPRKLNIDENEIASPYQINYLNKLLEQVINHENRDKALITTNIYSNSCIQDANELLKAENPKKKLASITIARLIRTKEQLNNI